VREEISKLKEGVREIEKINESLKHYSLIYTPKLELKDLAGRTNEEGE
jgi:hypothetical protein